MGTQPVSARSAVTFSVVAPAYNEHETLPYFYRRVVAVMESLGEPFGLLVDDGSADRTPALLGTPLLGGAGLALVVIFLAGIQLICLGILGEYFARVYDEVCNQPLYVLRDS